MECQFKIFDDGPVHLCGVETKLFLTRIDGAPWYLCQPHFDWAAEEIKNRARGTSPVESRNSEWWRVKARQAWANNPGI